MALQQSHSNASNDKRVILVDDDPDVRRSMTFLLRRYGFTVEDFANGLELLSAGASSNSDFLLLDYKLPHLNGLELLSKLRLEGITSPAILITGFFSNGLISKAEEVGFSRVVEKPAPIETIIRQIETSCAEADKGTLQ